MAENDEAVDVDVTKATPVAPAEATEVPAVMGSTFAERAAAAQGKKVRPDDVEDKAVAPKKTTTKRKKS